MILVCACGGEFDVEKPLCPSCVAKATSSDFLGNMTLRDLVATAVKMFTEQIKFSGEVAQTWLLERLSHSANPSSTMKTQAAETWEARYRELLEKLRHSATHKAIDAFAAENMALRLALADLIDDWEELPDSLASEKLRKARALLGASTVPFPLGTPEAT